MSRVLAPLIPEIGVLALPYHHWGTRWMTPHHVLTRLAHYFNVLWLEPALHWREIGQPARERQGIGGPGPALPASFGRYVPEPWLPDVYRPKWLRAALVRQRVRHGWKRLEARGARVRVLHLWHPQFEAAFDAGRHDLSLYHIDDEYSFSPDAPPLSAEEARVMRRANQVFAISPALMERKGGVNPHTAFVPEGVDFRLYATPVAEPADLKPIGRPRIGYTGALKRQLDWPLLRALALRHPEWSFVYVGPRTFDARAQVIADEMARLPNVHFLGEKTVVDLAAYPQHFDVCTMPYVMNGYTENIYPLKLHEYLASGRPVVGTPIRSLKDFSGVIGLASGLEEWSAALSAALAPQSISSAAADTRQAAARPYDWSVLIHRIATTICARLGPDVSARLGRIDVDAAHHLSRI